MKGSVESSSPACNYCTLHKPQKHALCEVAHRGCFCSCKTVTKVKCQA